MFGNGVTLLQALQSVPGLWFAARNWRSATQHIGGNSLIVHFNQDIVLPDIVAHLFVDADNFFPVFPRQRSVLGGG
jgi:hypothetical protein